MKRLIRRLLRQAGWELLHRADDPVLAHLRTLHERLRLGARNRVAWDDLLPQPAMHAHLRHLLELHRIELLLDVGANRGQFASLARSLGYVGKIVSFEPSMEAFAALQAAARNDPAWQVHRLALGDATAEMSLHVYRDDTFSSLHAANQAGESRFGDYLALNRVETVTVRLLDSLAAEIPEINATHRIMLKTDTQGHDLAVLRGAKAILASTAAVVAEASFQPIYDDAPSLRDLSAQLEPLGFSLSGVYPLSHRETDLALIEADCFFTRPSPTA
jgi:FkbM family methyltransferase